MLSFTIIILLFFVCFCFSGKHEYGFPKEKTNVLKALLPFFIILHHANGGVLTDFIPTGKFVVAIFFCISGYGLESKFIRNGVFSFNDLLRRLKLLFLPTVVPVFLYLSILYFEKESVLTAIINSFKDISLPLPNSWFVVVLGVLYLLYYVSCQVKKGHSHLLFLFLLVLMLNLIFFVFQKEATYLYGSNFGFVMGVCIKNKETLIIKLLNNKTATVLLPFILVTSYIIIPVKSFAIINICLYAFVVMMMFFTLPNIKEVHPIMRHLCIISYEIYLCHGILLRIVPSSLFGNYALYIVGLIFATLFVSTLCSTITKVMFKMK